MAKIDVTFRLNLNEYTVSLDSFSTFAVLLKSGNEFKWQKLTETNKKLNNKQLNS